MPNLRILTGAEAGAGMTADEIAALTERATLSTFYTDGMSAEQIEANERIPRISPKACFDAAGSGDQHLAAAFEGDRLVGFVIATRHGPDDLELDWLMVDPDLHGTSVAASLMAEGMSWLGEERPIWLTVVRHNERAIRFYRRFGFEIDETADLGRVVPSCVMRRRPASL